MQQAGPEGVAATLLPVHAAGGALVAASLLAARAVRGEIWYPGCGFRWVTGLPCPGCGGTHALAALASGDIAGALAANPLVAGGAALVIGLVVVAAAGRVFGEGGRLSSALRRIGRACGITRMVVVAVLANWIYLLATHGGER